MIGRPRIDLLWLDLFIFQLLLLQLCLLVVHTCLIFFVWHLTWKHSLCTCSGCQQRCMKCIRDVCCCLGWIWRFCSMCWRTVHTAHSSDAVFPCAEISIWDLRSLPVCWRNACSCTVLFIYLPPCLSDLQQLSTRQFSSARLPVLNQRIQFPSIWFLLSFKDCMMTRDFLLQVRTSQLWRNSTCWELPASGCDWCRWKAKHDVCLCARPCCIWPWLAVSAQLLWHLIKCKRKDRHYSWLEWASFVLS